NELRYRDGDLNTWFFHASATSRRKQASTRDPVISAIIPSILESDNERLTAPFHIEEFKEAMFSMQADKCPGPDGICELKIFSKNVVLGSPHVISLLLRI
ncbi:hypothetical protein L195_g061362, partial [Trifolium pratense]